MLSKSTKGEEIYGSVAETGWRGRAVEKHVNDILEEDDLDMVGDSFCFNGRMVGGEGGFRKGGGEGATKDVIDVFIVLFADRTYSCVGLMSMKEEAIGWPFTPKRFEEVGIFVVRKGGLNPGKINGVERRYVACCLVDILENGGALIVSVEG